MGERTTVLFDWRLTLFGEESYHDFLSGAMASIGRFGTAAELAGISDAIESAKRDPRLVTARQRMDSSQKRHREFVMQLFTIAGLDDELAGALYERDGTLASSFPYVDAADVLREIRARGCRIGVVSDIHFPLAPHFEHHGMAELIDAYVLSYEHDFQKPEAKAFEIALETLGSRPEETIMVGDNYERDGGAARVGILTLILPPVEAGAERGLEAVLRLL